MRDSSDSAQAMRQMPQYECHKTVWALKIKAVEQVPIRGHEGDDAVAALVFDEPGYAPRRVRQDFMNKHQPVAGGYFVVYKDGYQSFSPREAFESGYTISK